MINCDQQQSKAIYKHIRIFTESTICQNSGHYHNIMTYEANPMLTDRIQGTEMIQQFSEAMYIDIQ